MVLCGVFGILLPRCKSVGMGGRWLVDRAGLKTKVRFTVKEEGEKVPKPEVGRVKTP